MTQATLPLLAKAHAAVARGRVWSSVLVIGLALAAAGALAAEPETTPLGETAAAREQARLCERENLEAGAAACREALRLGIGPARRGPVREMLARHLVALERWNELADILSPPLEPHTFTMGHKTLVWCAFSGLTPEQCAAVKAAAATHPVARAHRGE